MQAIDWVEKALHSEIEFSKALKSQPIPYLKFIHLYNSDVPWGGDYNRAVGVEVTDFDSFDEVDSQVAAIHRQKGLQTPNRFDIAPPALDPAVWREPLERRGYSLQTAVFFQAPTQPAELPAGIELYQPSVNEHFAWYLWLAEKQGDATADWFQPSLPLKENFHQIFLPYWLFRNGEQVGWVYAAHLGDFTRLFEVEIYEEFQGQGLGTFLMQAIVAESYRQGMHHVLLQTGERLRPFYERCGFRECTRNSIIRLNE